MTILDPFTVLGKVVFIAGGGRGIGRGIAEVFAESGADVAMNARTAEFVEPAAAAITAQTGRRVVPIVADMTDPDAVQVAIDRVLDEFGHIDVLVNAVGDAFVGALVSLSATEIEYNLSVNVRATLYGSRAIGKHFQNRNAGKVINVSSTSASRGGANLSVYAAAKAAVEALTRSLALEWAPFGVNVNGIAPGWYPDPHRRVALDRDAETSRLARIPLARVGDVREVGYLARFLASPASDYLTGQTIYLDGGASL